MSDIDELKDCLVASCLSDIMRMCAELRADGMAVKFDLLAGASGLDSLDVYVFNDANHFTSWLFGNSVPIMHCMVRYNKARVDSLISAHDKIKKLTEVRNV